MTTTSDSRVRVRSVLLPPDIASSAHCIYKYAATGKPSSSRTTASPCGNIFERLNSQKASRTLRKQYLTHVKVCVQDPSSSLQVLPDNVRCLSMKPCPQTNIFLGRYPYRHSVSTRRSQSQCPRFTTEARSPSNKHIGTLSAPEA